MIYQTGNETEFMKAVLMRTLRGITRDFEK